MLGLVIKLKDADEADIVLPIFLGLYLFSTAGAISIFVSSTVS